jgi:hypothetical protein
LTLRHILIAVPSMAGVIKTQTATTLIMTMRHLTRAGIQAEYLNIDSSDIVYARNVFADIVLNSDILDGLLFVDSDMLFRPLLVSKMIEFDRDVVGAAYPKRMLDIDQFSRTVVQEGVFTPEVRNKALSTTYEFTVLPSWHSVRPGPMRVVKGFTTMAAAGMGCTLISRTALKAMVDAGVVSPRKDILNGVERTRWGFFDPVKVGDITLSEDFSFCYRWTKLMERDLWVCVDETMTHLGDFPHEARYMDRLSRTSGSPNREADRSQATPDTDLTPQS